MDQIGNKICEYLGPKLITYKKNFYLMENKKITNFLGLFCDPTALTNAELGSMWISLIPDLINKKFF